MLGDFLSAIFFGRPRVGRNLEPYLGESWHPMPGLMAGPPQDILLTLRIRNKFEATFQVEGRKLSTPPLSEMQQVLEELAFHHSIRRTQGWCPILLTQEPGGWTADLGDRRCWFDLANATLRCQKLAPDQKRPRKKAPFRIQSSELAPGLRADVYDGEQLMVELSWQGRPLQTSLIDDWPDAEPPVPASQRVAALWIYFAGMLGHKATPLGENAYQLEERRLVLDPQGGELRIYEKPLLEAPLFRGEGVTISVRFRNHPNQVLGQFLHQGRVMQVAHQDDSTHAHNHGFEKSSTRSSGTWARLDSDLLNLARRGGTVELVELSPGCYGAALSEEDNSCHGYYRSQTRLQFDLNRMQVDIESESHSDTSS